MIVVTDQEGDALLDLIEGRLAQTPERLKTLRGVVMKLHDDRAAREETERIHQNAIQPRDRRR